MDGQQFFRRLPVGAELQAGGGVHFRVWAPKEKFVSVVLETSHGKPIELRLTREGQASGMYSGFAPDADAMSTYRYRLGEAGSLRPDPASRFQPDGPHGPSQVIDPGVFEWTDQQWTGPVAGTQVIYEMHIGTFTEAGTWDAAIEQLSLVADLGVTLLEVMPIAEFAGEFGWGYDGVDLYAPTRLYGPPDAMRRFVDRAHALGMGVILDVVYNHLGPDGNYLACFSDTYFTDAYENDWGQSLNFDGPGAEPVREFFIANAGYWIDEFHLDGLRLDATQSIFDASPRHIIVEIGEIVRKKAQGRRTIIVAENEPQDTTLVRPLAQGGYGLDMLWNDDFHHSSIALLTGHNEAYYTDYRGTAQEFVASAKHGFLYQGQWYKWQKNTRGTSTRGVAPGAFVNFLQNHDQVANSARGWRCHKLTSPGRLRAMTALMILMPGTPMLFQGQEFAASTPFLYFADHVPEQLESIRKGRREFLAQFPSMRVPEVVAQFADPGDPQTFEKCKLQLDDVHRHAEIYALHRDLIQLRRGDPTISNPARADYDGAVLGPDAFVLRYFSDDGNDRLLVVNLGCDLNLDIVPEPLLALPRNALWQVIWSSEDVCYGGMGTVPPVSNAGWRLPGQATLLLAAQAGEPLTPLKRAKKDNDD